MGGVPVIGGVELLTGGVVSLDIEPAGLDSLEGDPLDIDPLDMDPLDIDPLDMDVSEPALPMLDDPLIDGSEDMLDLVRFMPWWRDVIFGLAV